MRASWAALREAGLPSQLDHRGATNAVHLTIVSAPVIPEAAVEEARQALGPLLPLRVRVSGVPHLTLARRVPRERVQEALDVLGWGDEVLTLTELRRWDPDAGVVVPVGCGA